MSDHDIRRLVRQLSANGQLLDFVVDVIKDRSMNLSLEDCIRVQEHVRWRLKRLRRHIAIPSGSAVRMPGEAKPLAQHSDADLQACLIEAHRNGLLSHTSGRGVRFRSAQLVLKEVRFRGLEPAVPAVRLTRSSLGNVWHLGSSDERNRAACGQMTTSWPQETCIRPTCSKCLKTAEWKAIAKEGAF